MTYGMRIRTIRQIGLTARSERNRRGISLQAVAERVGAATSPAISSRARGGAGYGRPLGGEGAANRPTQFAKLRSTHVASDAIATREATERKP